MNRYFHFYYKDYESANDQEIVRWCYNEFGGFNYSRWKSISSISIQLEYTHQLSIYIENDDDAMLFTLRWL